MVPLSHGPTLGLLNLMEFAEQSHRSAEIYYPLRHSTAMQRISPHCPLKKKMVSHLPPIDLVAKALVSPVGVLQAYTCKTPTHTPFQYQMYRIISPSGKASVIGKLCSRSAPRTPSFSPNPSADRRDFGTTPQFNDSTRLPTGRGNLYRCV